MSIQTMEEVEGEKTTELATLSEESEVLAQMTKVSEYTVKPGLLRLPVDDVTTAENSENIVIELKHPFRDNIRKYFAKPEYWADDYEVIEFLGWYGYTYTNMYTLKTERVYVEYDRDNDEWTLVEPPREFSWKDPKSWIVPMKDKGESMAGCIYEGVKTLFRIPRGWYSAILSMIAIGIYAGAMTAVAHPPSNSTVVEGAIILATLGGFVAFVLAALTFPE